MKKYLKKIANNLNKHIELLFSVFLAIPQIVYYFFREAVRDYRRKIKYNK